jgi:hypothetical protein
VVPPSRVKVSFVQGKHRTGPGQMPTVSNSVDRMSEGQRYFGTGWMGSFGFSAFADRGLSLGKWLV